MSLSLSSLPPCSDTKCPTSQMTRTHTIQLSVLNSQEHEMKRQCPPVLVLLRNLDAKGAADSCVQKTAELTKAVQGQHNDSSQQSAEQLSKDIHEGTVPVAMEHNGWAQHPSWVQSRSCELPTCMSPKRCYVNTRIPDPVS